MRDVREVSAGEPQIASELRAFHQSETIASRPKRDNPPVRGDDLDVDQATDLIGTAKLLSELTREEQAIVEQQRREAQEAMREVERKLRRGGVTGLDE